MSVEAHQTGIARLGPLNGHRNYIVHIALPNYTDYVRLKKKHGEEKRATLHSNYEEFRLFFNAIESFNNIPDYLYWDYEDRIKPKTVDEFRTSLHEKFPALRRIADLANAYKHCVRSDRKGNKNERLLWAKDLQKTDMRFNVAHGADPDEITVQAVYEFSSMKEHEASLDKAFQYWVAYHNNPNAEEMIEP